MYKYFFEKKKLLKISVISLICASVLFCFNILSVSVSEGTFEEVFLKARESSVYTINHEYHADAFFSSMILFLMIPIICSIFIEDSESAKAYAFLRMSGVKKWYKFKMLQSLFYCLFSQTVYNLVFVVAVYFAGFRTANVLSAVAYFTFAIVSGTIVLFLFVESANVFSMFFKPHLVSVLVTSLCISLIIATAFLYDYQMRYSILSCYCISWHIYTFTSDFYLNPYPAWINYIIISVAEFLLAVAGEKFVMKKDWL